MDEELKERVLEAQPALAQLSDLPRSLFFEILDRYARGACDWNEIGSEKHLLELAGDLAYLTLLPLDTRIWGFEFEPTDEQLNQGCAMLLQALAFFIPAPDQGQPFRHYPGSLIARLRDPNDPALGRGHIVLEDFPDA